jgi:hypothetical protein
MESLPIMKGLCISNQMSRYLKILGQMSIILQILAYLLSFFLWCWGLNQGLCLEPHHKPPSLFLMCFLRYSHKNYCHGLTLNHISPSLVARITGVGYWCPAVCFLDDCWSDLGEVECKCSFDLKLNLFFFLVPFFLKLYWGYIVTFTKVITVHHGWIHLPPSFSFTSLNSSSCIY